MQMWAGAAAFCIGLVCLLVDGCVAVIMLRTRLFTNPQFAMLYLNMVLAECMDLAICTFWLAPIIFFNAEELGETFLSRKLGQTVITGWSAIIYNMIIIAINRYIAIARPMTYKSVFSQRNCVIMLVVCWVFAVVNTVGYLYPAEWCDLLPSPVMLGWAYKDTTCGWALNWHCVASCSVSIVVLLSANTATLRAMRRQHATVSVAAKSLNMPDKTREAPGRSTVGMSWKRKAEVRLFVQAALNATIAESMVVSFHIISLMFPTPLGYFCCATLPFIIAHGSNGFLMLMLYPELRKKIVMMLGMKSE